MINRENGNNQSDERHQGQNPLDQAQRESIAGLLQKNAAMQALLESLAQGVVIINKHRKILYINAAAERMFDYSASEILGKPHDVLVPERFYTLHIEYMKEYYGMPKVRPMGIGMDLYGRRSDGSEFPVEISLSFVKEQDDILVISLISDITFRKNTEKIIEDHLKELAEVNRNLESFSYSVSHDLKSPLQTIIGFAAILLEDYGDKSDPQLKEYLSLISHSAIKMKDLINDILEISRVSRRDLIREDVDLTLLAKEIMSELGRRDTVRNVSVKIRENMHENADAVLVRVLLNNLLSNAWKFTRKKGNPQIEIDSFEDNGKRVFFVRDNGAGFDMKLKDKLFAPFKRLHSDKDFEGTGAGLAIVDQVVKRHGGKIWAQSQVGRGASFYFTLK